MLKIVSVTILNSRIFYAMSIKSPVKCRKNSIQCVDCKTVKNPL